jgi:hypothetical protein
MASQWAMACAILPGMAVWAHDGKLYEVTSYYRVDADAWCYELVELSGQAHGLLEVRIPDATPSHGSFTPSPAEQVMFAAYGDAQIPWPIVRRFIDVVEASGDIGAVQAPTVNDPGGNDA